MGIIKLIKTINKGKTKIKYDYYKNETDSVLLQNILNNRDFITVYNKDNQAYFWTRLNTYKPKLVQANIIKVYKITLNDIYINEVLYDLYDLYTDITYEQIPHKALFKTMEEAMEGTTLPL